MVKVTVDIVQCDCVVCVEVIAVKATVFIVQLYCEGF